MTARCEPHVALSPELSLPAWAAEHAPSARPTWKRSLWHAAWRGLVAQPAPGSGRRCARALAPTAPAWSRGAALRTWPDAARAPESALGLCPAVGPLGSPLGDCLGWWPANRSAGISIGCGSPPRRAYRAGAWAACCHDEGSAPCAVAYAPDSECPISYHGSRNPGQLRAWGDPGEQRRARSVW